MYDRMTEKEVVKNVIFSFNCIYRGIRNSELPRWEKQAFVVRQSSFGSSEMAINVKPVRFSWVS